VVAKVLDKHHCRGHGKCSRSGEEVGTVATAAPAATAALTGGGAAAAASPASIAATGYVALCLVAHNDGYVQGDSHSSASATEDPPR